MLVAALALPGRVAGQDTAGVQPGMRVRLTLRPAAPSGYTTRVVGTLLRLGPDSVTVYDQERLGVVTEAVRAAQRLDVSRGRRSHAGRGALIGLAAGAIGGILSGLIVCNGGDCTTSGGDWAGLVVGVLGVGGALAGTGLGALVGALIHSERWEPVPLGPVAPPSRARGAR